ncbi:MAG: MotA/TolQ/ExbB proton channel family protein [Flavobacteriaceae bacterium]
MPFSEFITSGDLKFIIVFSIFLSLAIFNFIKKLKARNNQNTSLVDYYNSKIKTAGFWIIISSVFSLLLGFIHSFYFIGKAGGMAPNLIFQGVSYALITPVLGVGVFVIVNILYRILPANSDNS